MVQEFGDAEVWVMHEGRREDGRRDGMMWRFVLIILWPVFVAAAHAGDLVPAAKGPPTTLGELTAPATAIICGNRETQCPMPTFAEVGPAGVTTIDQVRWASGIVAALDAYRKEREQVAKSDVGKTWTAHIGGVSVMSFVCTAYPPTNCGADPGVEFTRDDLLGTLDRNIAWCEDALKKVGVSDR